MSDQPVIRTRHLTRYFGRKRAVYELELEVPQGTVFGFLGRNGSGKTTTIRMLLGLLAPTRGTANVLGYDSSALPPETRARIGYMTEEHQLYGWMSVQQAGDFQSRFYPRWQDKIFHAVIGHFGLNPHAKVKHLSRGERAGLCLAITLAPDPELLILDDPALGLDPVARRSLVESMIYLTRRTDRTIFFSSHQLADVERVADYIAVLDQSVLRACCPAESFRARIKEVRLRFADPPPNLPTIPGMLQAFRNGNDLRIVCANFDERTNQALRALGPTEMELTALGLEDALITYLGARGEKSFILPETEAQL
jgi:ABC-2 type transport system ATP-binding protein